MHKEIKITEGISEDQRIIEDGDIIWHYQDHTDEYHAKYILEHPYDTLDTFHKILFEDHKDDEMLELYSDHGLVAMLFKKNE